MPTTQKLIDRAKVKLMKEPNSTFVTTVLFSLRTVIIEKTDPLSLQIPTAATDGIHLIVNEDYFLNLTEDERIGLLFHETWHVALNHMERGKGLIHEVYNQAGDFVINYIAVSNGFTLPSGALLDNKYKDMSTKQVYDDLIKNPLPKTPQQACDVVFSPMDVFGNPLTPEEVDAREEKIKGTLIEAQIRSKTANQDPGSIPGEVAVQLEEILNPQLPWQVILQNYMTSFAKDDFTWRRPNRRFMPDYYLPSAYSEAIGHIAIAVDTSGSVSDQEFSHFISEINDINTKLNPEKLTIIDFDTRINSIQEVNPSKGVDTLSFKGRGGTAIAPVWDWIIDNTPVLTIVFSDMDFINPQKDPGAEVLWIAVNSSHTEMPFGETINIEV